MTFTEDDITHPIEIENVSWDYIHQALLQIHPSTKSFFILTDPITGSYIQCAGSAERLVVELRKYSDDAFKHYVIGKGANKSPLKVTWATVESKAGAIQVHDSEVLNIRDAQTLFHSFFFSEEVPGAYSRRNVTRLHQKNYGA